MSEWTPCADRPPSHADAPTPHGDVEITGAPKAVAFVVKTLAEREMILEAMQTVGFTLPESDAQREERRAERLSLINALRAIFGVTGGRARDNPTSGMIARVHELASETLIKWGLFR